MKLSIVIPVRIGGSPIMTLKSLSKQTFQDFQVIVSQDQVNNANWARNRGLELVKSPYVLFADDDVVFENDALEMMMDRLVSSPESAYCYGIYEMGGRTYCDQEFDAAILRHRNYISTMSIVKTDLHPGFDENIRRLQDWDVWLTMLGKGQHGIHLNKKIFSTFVKANGITYNGEVSYDEAKNILMKKHGIL